MTQTPLSIIPKGCNAGAYKFFFEAKFDYEPTKEDVYAASQSIGYGNIMSKEGGYILSVTDIKEITNSEHEEDNGLWLARWCAIPD